MLKFKEFLLNEDLGIGPEGTSKNPSIKNYMDSLRKEKKDLVQKKKLAVGTQDEKDRLTDLLQQKKQEIEQTKLLSNPSNLDKPVTPTIPSLGTTPSSKESAFDKLIRGKPSSTVGPTSMSSTLSPSAPGTPETSIYSGYNVSGSLGSSMVTPELDVEVRGKTSKNLRL